MSEEHRITLEDWYLHVGWDGKSRHLTGHVRHTYDGVACRFFPMWVSSDLGRVHAILLEIKGGPERLQDLIFHDFTVHNRSAVWIDMDVPMYDDHIDALHELRLDLMLRRI